jgi:hypothetical protein
MQRNAAQDDASPVGLPMDISSSVMKPRRRALKARRALPFGINHLIACVASAHREVSRHRQPAQQSAKPRGTRTLHGLERSPLNQTTTALPMPSTRRAMQPSLPAKALLRESPAYCCMWSGRHIIVLSLCHPLTQQASPTSRHVDPCIYRTFNARSERRSWATGTHWISAVSD